MRQDGGYDTIIEAIKRLGLKHQEHIKLYGADNDMRLTGHHETASIENFSYGVADRGASVRIPNTAKNTGKGYFEDRRPASNMDPYIVTAKIAETTILWDKAELPLLGEEPAAASAVVVEDSSVGGGGVLSCSPIVLAKVAAAEENPKKAKEEIKE